MFVIGGNNFLVERNVPANVVLEVMVWLVVYLIPFLPNDHFLKKELFLFQFWMTVLEFY